MAAVTADLEYEGTRYTVTQDWDTSDDADEEARHVWYMWTQGNYGCDCNRSLFISRAYDDFPCTITDENDYRCFPCGDTITLVSLTLDGKDLLEPERLAAIGLVGL